MDINSGSAEGKGSLGSTSNNVTCTGGGCGGASAGTITTSANIDGEGDASPLVFRGFAGLQFNLPFVRIFGQVDKSLGNEVVALSSGVRFVY